MAGNERYVSASNYESSDTCKRPRFFGKIPARVSLYALSFSGFVVSFMMRMDINLALVSMVKYHPTNESMNFVAACTNSGNSSDLTSLNLTDPKAAQPESGEFDWSASAQTAIISSFYVCYVLSQIIGGVLTQAFGTKNVFGGSQLLTAICSWLIPTAAEWDYRAIVVLRSIQGVASGLTWPAMYAIVGKWIPMVERSRFMSSFQGFSFGIGLTYPICGFIIAHFGWRYVFYTTGSIGVVWCIFWYVYAFDTPMSHPRITTQEFQYIQGSVGHEVSEGMPTPWKSILTSMPAWSIGITTFGRIWVSYVFITHGPVYMKNILGFDIQTNGLLNGAPFICSYFSSVAFCYIGDLLVRKQILSLTNVRKVFSFLSQVVPGVLVLVVGYLGCNMVSSLFVWFIAVTFITAAYAGAMANIVDIAPNFAGPVLAFAQTIHMSASFISPYAANFLLVDDFQSLERWKNVFFLAACIACCTYVVYQIFGTADIQPWNYRDQKPPRNSSDDDSQPLNDPVANGGASSNHNHYSNQQQQQQRRKNSSDKVQIAVIVPSDKSGNNNHHSARV